MKHIFYGKPPNEEPTNLEDARPAFSDNISQPTTTPASHGPPPLASYDKRPHSQGKNHQTSPDDASYTSNSQSTAIQSSLSQGHQRPPLSSRKPPMTYQPRRPANAFAYASSPTHIIQHGIAEQMPSARYSSVPKIPTWREHQAEEDSESSAEYTSEEELLRSHPKGQAIKHARPPLRKAFTPTAINDARNAQLHSSAQPKSDRQRARETRATTNTAISQVAQEQPEVTPTRKESGDSVRSGSSISLTNYDGSNVSGRAVFTGPDQWDGLKEHIETLHRDNTLPVNAENSSSPKENSPLENRFSSIPRDTENGIDELGYSAATDVYADGIDQNILDQKEITEQRLPPRTSSYTHTSQAKSPDAPYHIPPSRAEIVVGNPKTQRRSSYQQHYESGSRGIQSNPMITFDASNDPKAERKSRSKTVKIYHDDKYDREIDRSLPDRSSMTHREDPQLEFEPRRRNWEPTRYRQERRKRHHEQYDEEFEPRSVQEYFENHIPDGRPYSRTPIIYHGDGRKKEFEFQESTGSQDFENMQYSGPSKIYRSGDKYRGAEYMCNSLGCSLRTVVWPNLNDFKHHLIRRHKNEDHSDYIRRSVYQGSDKLYDPDVMVINSHNTPHSSVDTNATTSRHDIGVEEMIQHSMMIKRKNNETRERLLNMTQERENDVELSHSNVKEELRDTETDGVSVPGDHEMIPSGSNTPLDPLKTERRSPGAGAKDGEIHPSLPPIENTISPEKHDGGWTWGTTRPSIYIRDGQHDRAAPETNARAFKNAEQQHAEREIQREQNRRRDHLSEEENQVRLVDDQNESRHEQSKEAITHQPAAVSEPKNPKESEQLNEVIEKDEQPLFEGFLSDHDIDFEQFDHEDYIPPGMVEELGLTDFSPEDWLRSTMVDETGLEHYSPKEVTRDERPTSGNNSDLHHRRSAQMLVSRSSSETRFPASQASASNFVRSRASSTSSFGISAPGIMASHGEGPQRFQEIDVDSDSGISSYAASVLSVQSLASSATDISKGSGYSPHQIATATKELVTIFQEDTFLVSLYKSAINDSSIGPEKLQRNLRRLFKQFAEHLKGEAKDSLEYLASRLVSLKARFLAQSIVQEFSGRIASPAKDLEADHESSEDEEEEQSSTVDDAAFDDLVVFREFLVGSDAFSTLRAQIQNFAVPKTAQAQRKFLIGTKSLPETAAPDVEDEVQRIRDLLATRDSVQPGMQIDWGMIGRSRKNTEHVLQAAKASLENYQSNNRLPPKESNHRQATRTTDSFVLPSIIVAVIFGIQEDVFGFEKHPVSFVLATFALFILAGISRVLTFWFWTYVLERAYGQKLQPSNPLVSKQYDAVGIFSSNPSDDSPAVGRDRIWNKLSTKIGSWQAKLKNVSSKHFHALLIAFGCFESALEPGKVRLRWRCGCGDSFIGDFTEHQASGISNMATHMERLTGAKVTSITSHSENTAPKTTGQHPGLWLRNAMESLGSLVNKRSKQRTLPQHTPNTAVGTSTPGHGSQQGQMLHLLSCLHAGRFRKTLAQDRIESFKTDRQLFYFIRDQYRVHRGRIKGLLSLKTVKGIYFTKFRLPMGGSVELRAHNPCCIQPHVCECLPPPSRVEPSKDAEYRCEPVPSSVWPPIDPHYLSHLFKDPTCINENDTWILDQLPKRTRGELQGKVGKPADGWGIYYEEGWDRDIITLVVVLLFIVSSLVFGVTWSYFKMDVQGAFGVSSYMMASCAAMISFVAMKMDKA